MKEIVVEIKNEQGVHARPAGQIVNIAKRYKVTLEIEKIGEIETVDGKNVFGVMSLGAGKGDKLRFRAISKNEENLEKEKQLLEELKKMIEVDKFFEE